MNACRPPHSTTSVECHVLWVICFVGAGVCGGGGLRVEMHVQLLTIAAFCPSRVHLLASADRLHDCED